jgi:gliding motility-associated-like protein
VVTITDALTLTPTADVTVCDSYILPVLAAGSYYTQSGGQGSVLAAGTVLTSSQTVYIYLTQGPCTAEDSFDVTVNATPSFTLSGGCQNNAYVVEVVFTDSSVDVSSAQYQWSTTTGSLGTQPTDGSSIEALSDGLYSVIVSVGGCDFTQTFDALGTQCTIQKGISANGDGKNDNFDLEGQDVSKLSIYNRYGMKVYSLSNYTNQWSGQSDKGEELPDGTYYYVIERRNGQSLTGWVYINRSQN